MYDRRAPSLFKQYGGGNWPAVLLPEGFNSADRFGGFGYGVVMVDEEGIVRSIGDYAVENTVNKLFIAGTREAKNAEEAAAVGGYWHNGKCWRFYDDNSISAEEVAGVVDERFKLSSDSKVTIEGQQWNVDFFQSNHSYLTVGFNGGEKIKLKSSKLSSSDKSPISVLLDGHFKTKSDSGESEIIHTSKGRGKVHFKNDGTILATGKLRPKTGKGEKRPFEIQLHESILSLGNSKLEIKGNEAFLSGELGVRTYRQIKNMITDHPDVRTITLTEIEGSVDDEINLHAGRLIREAGLTTKVTKDSKVHSGGVDLLCAGLKRIIETGAVLEVQTRNNMSIEGVTYPKDHPAHQHHLTYFQEMLGEKAGSKYYFLTIRASPAKYVPRLTAQQIKKWNLATE